MIEISNILLRSQPSGSGITDILGIIV